MLILASTNALAQLRRIEDKHCFTEQTFAQEALTLILSRYKHHFTNSPWDHIHQERSNRRRPKIELVTDTVDQFGRTFCLIILDKKIGSL
jgi:hypothetical protein